MSCFDTVHRVNTYIQSHLLKKGGRGVSLDELYADYRQYERYAYPRYDLMSPPTKEQVREIVSDKIGRPLSNVWEGWTLLKFTEPRFIMKDTIKEIVVPICDPNELIMFKAKL